MADGVSRAAGIWRRRSDDAVASADRRNHPAARARPLSGLSRRRIGQFQHIRSGRRRLSDRSVRLAIDLPCQRAARARRRRARAAPRVAPGRSPPYHLRYPGPRSVHHVRKPGDPGARAIAAHAIEHGADGARPFGIWNSFARRPVMAGAAQHVSAHTPAPVQGTLDLAQRRLGGLPRRRAGFVDHLPADLSARGPRRLAGRDRADAAAADLRHRSSVH